ncbi:hypothetical protein G7Y89_g8037 [Cudoniella acicularis]|uniref:Uncharacterized protein n=1 Tax=Cudoniella acicularis TaxID=354080 RepID=A0A8H4W1G6_9HELO|nr:hypothetical protein G7Y89_g8037 [Cudoniella acicularis]
MATAETVSMGPVHTPKEESIKAFNEIEVELKKNIQHLRHETAKHEPQYFYRVKNLTDHQLTNFSADDLKEVRIATSAYGMHLFGKVLLPESDPSHSFPENPHDAYFLFRAFIPGGAESAKLHCIHMEEKELPNGDKVFKAIFNQDEPLEWFDE